MQPGTIDLFAQFLARHVLWLFAVPILYAAVATAVEHGVDERVIQFAGFAICAVLLALLGVPIAFYLV
ncbi:MAG: hypothetical protein PHC88_09065 [Terrimicrobiaceae bacterium]|nr:hypothetical protein [Terrimicrobiaceae bacterium]